MSVLIIGAGYAGCTLAALLAHEGCPVTLLEAHTTVGGCAGFFRRGQYTFDVGATTISGIEANQSVGRVFGHLGITPNVIRQDPGMLIRMPNTTVVRWANQQQWIEEASHHFRGNQEAFWNEQYSIAESVWHLVGATHHLPPRSVRDIVGLIKPRFFGATSLLPGLIQPVWKKMKRWGATDSNFVRFIDEQLLISTQGTSQTAPWLTGAMGLTYPSDTYYPVGGMFRPALDLMRHAQRRGADVRFRRTVQSIQRLGSRWKVTCANGEVYNAETVVSTVPIWNMQRLCEDSVRAYMRRQSQRFPDSWCALTLTFAVDGIPRLPSAYMQLYLDSPIPHVHSNSLFVSVSHPSDTQKAPGGHSTVTVSTHTRSSAWESMSAQDVLQQKQVVIAAMMELIRRRVHEFDGMEVLHLEGGTPSTWEKYTLRMGGRVGGIPHNIRKPLISLPPNETPFRGLYMIGDTTFPGQGTPAVMMSAWNTAARIFAS